MKTILLLTASSLFAFISPAYMKQSPTTIAESVIIQNKEFNTEALPKRLKLNRDFGIISALLC